jgi:hypothetical protein
MTTTHNTGTIFYISTAFSFTPHQKYVIFVNCIVAMLISINCMCFSLSFFLFAVFGFLVYFRFPNSIFVPSLHKYGLLFGLHGTVSQ